MKSRLVFGVQIVVSWALGYLGGATVYYLYTGTWAWHLGG